MRVIVQENLVVGFWELTHLLLGSDSSTDQNTVTITKDNED